jgi:hypothetical protein
MTPTPASNAGPSGLHVRYEKAGLILDALPIPWNADAVIVEAIVRLPSTIPCTKDQFTLQFSNGAPTVWADVLRQESKKRPVRVFFRFPILEQKCSVQVFWREHSLGQIELPILSSADFEQGFALEWPSIHVLLGDRSVACQAFVSAQAKGLFASGVVRSVGPLAAALTVGLRVSVKRVDGDDVGSANVAFTSAQLRLRQTLVTVALPRLRSVGIYEVAWHLANRCLHTQRVRVVSKQTLLKSLRISATRFHVTSDNGARQVVRTLPTRDGQVLLDGIAEIAPVFFVCSGEAGMAGLVPFALRALVGDTITTEAIKDFSLGCGNVNLGNLPLLAAPSADFNAEGGFAPLDDFLWSAAAEEQLNERLGKLLDGG